MKLVFFKSDIEECSLGTDLCDRDNGLCTNSPGGYSCQCKEGYQGNGFTCQGTKEDFRGVLEFMKRKMKDEIEY